MDGQESRQTINLAAGCHFVRFFADWILKSTKSSPSIFPMIKHTLLCRIIIIRNPRIFQLFSLFTSTFGSILFTFAVATNQPNARFLHQIFVSFRSPLVFIHSFYSSNLCLTLVRHYRNSFSVALSFEKLKAEPLPCSLSPFLSLFPLWFQKLTRFHQIFFHLDFIWTISFVFVSSVLCEPFSVLSIRFLID